MTGGLSVLCSLAESPWSTCSPVGANTGVQCAKVQVLQCPHAVLHGQCLHRGVLLPHFISYLQLLFKGCVWSCDLYSHDKQCCAGLCPCLFSYISPSLPSACLAVCLLAHLLFPFPFFFVSLSLSVDSPTCLSVWPSVPLII